MLRMNERIKKVRKALELTQQEFADRIGMKRNSIALIENGRNTSDQTVFAICREFNVNEEWLRTGSGEMFKASPSSVLDALSEEYGLSNAAYVMVEKFVTLKPEAQETIFNYVREVAAALADKISENTLSTLTSNKLTEKSLNKRTLAGINTSGLSDEELGKLIRQEMKLEEKAEEKSEVS